MQIGIRIRNPGSNNKYVHMWQVNDDGLSSLLDVAELLGVRGLKSDRRPDPSKARKPHASASAVLRTRIRDPVPF